MRFVFSLKRLTTGEQRIPAVLVKTSNPVTYTVALQDNEIVLGGANRIFTAFPKGQSEAASHQGSGKRSSLESEGENTEVSAARFAATSKREKKPASPTRE